MNGVVRLGANRYTAHAINRGTPLPIQLTGRYAIAATPDAVWATLNDLDILRICVPGCDTLEKTDTARFAGAAAIGPVRASFDGGVHLVESEPLRRCILKGEVQGGEDGFAEGEVEVLLSPEAEGTAVTYTCVATIGGELARMDENAIGLAAREITDEFFSRLSVEVTTAPSRPMSEQLDDRPNAPAQVAQDPVPGPPSKEGVGPEIWVVGLIAVIVILLILFGLVL